MTKTKEWIDGTPSYIMAIDAMLDAIKWGVLLFAVIITLLVIFTVVL